MGEITNADLRAVAADLKSDFAARLDQADKNNERRHADLSARVDRTNNTVITHDRMLINHGLRVASVERQIGRIERKAIRATEGVPVTWRARAKHGGAMAVISSVIAGAVELIKAWLAHGAPTPGAK